MSNGFAVRPATAADVPELYQMARALAEHEGTIRNFAAREEDWRRDGFGAVPRFQALVAERPDGLAGMVTYTRLYSTGLARDALFVIDFFVKPGARGAGIGQALLARIAAAAVIAGAPAVEMAVRERNRAVRLYRRAGFRPVTPFSLIALTDPELTTLAQTVASLTALLGKSG